ncbi:MAG: lysophospholipid acyltransferase family protein [Gemmatimonadota bacterium]|nr:lysophospholipid acyltransferase family protein [Gemmatimonadota bacterium]
MADEVVRARRRARRINWVARVGGAGFRALARSWRLTVINEEPVRALQTGGQPWIFAFWHGHMLPLLWRHRGSGIGVLISEHGDGEMIAQVALGLGYATVRGSTTRGAQRALLGVIRAVESGQAVGITPDGPRGPAEEFAPGALVVAQRTGAPIVLLAIGADREWRLRSWDGFRIPKPFARVTIAYSDPIYVRAASSREAADEAPRFQEMLRALAAGIERKP